MAKSKTYILENSKLDIDKNLISGLGIVNLIKYYPHNESYGGQILVDLTIHKSKLDEVLNAINTDFKRHHFVFSKSFFKVIANKFLTVICRNAQNSNITLRWRVSVATHTPTNLEIISYNSLKYSFVRFPPIGIFGVYNKPQLKIVK